MSAYPYPPEHGAERPLSPRAAAQMRDAPTRGPAFAPAPGQGSALGARGRERVPAAQAARLPAAVWLRGLPQSEASNASPPRP